MPRPPKTAPSVGRSAANAIRETGRPPGGGGGRRVTRKKLDTKIIHSLDKGLEVLELVAANGEEIGLTSITGALKWDKSTVFRLLTTLIRRGYIEQDPETKRYRLGFRVLHLERQLFQSLDLPKLSRDLLTRLANATGEAAHLATLHKDQVIIIAQRESPARMAVNAHVGSIEPLHSTALGKAILMQLSDEALERAVAGIEYTAYTACTLTTPWALTDNIRKARSVGYTVDDEELTPEVRCIAAPAVIPGSRRFYAIGISGPSLRVVPARVPMLAEQVRNATEEFTRLFGGKAAE
jgi:IclR family acetate operon transcriptional repressor